MASDFPSAVDISFLAIWHIKIICISEKVLPEDKSKIKFKFPSTIVLVKNKKNTMVSIGFASALYQKMFIVCTLTSNY